MEAEEDFTLMSRAPTVLSQGRTDIHNKYLKSNSMLGRIEDTEDFEGGSSKRVAGIGQRMSMIAGGGASTPSNS